MNNLKVGQIIKYSAIVKSGYHANSDWQKYLGADGDRNRKIFRKELTGEGLYLGKSRLWTGTVYRQWLDEAPEFLHGETVQVLAVQDVSTQNYRKPFYVLLLDACENK